tara:strand:+ start:10693 stop:11436 length:744 start_codon:yes stop_codon:yes gene_type:complete
MLKTLKKYLPPSVKSALRSLITPNYKIKALESRIELLEKRIRNNRWFAVEEMAHYLVGAQIEGDYCEFGVFKGETFSHACNVGWPQEINMRFIAFDSFEGLPKPKGLDAEGGYSSNFHHGEFACSQEDFEKNLRNNGVDMSNVISVKGWFEETLNDNTAKKLQIEKIAAAWIDGDLYESTVPILKFLTSRISVGTIILFDDWRVFRNLPDYGEQRACREWLDENPHISLREIFSFGHHGVAFTVASC